MMTFFYILAGYILFGYIAMPFIRILVRDTPNLEHIDEDRLSWIIAYVPLLNVVSFGASITLWAENKINIARLENSTRALLKSDKEELIDIGNSILRLANEMKIKNSLKSINNA